MAAYRKLVYETPGFTDYFFAATPIREIAELNIGSRPASRKATRAIEDLRAIPWGFCWGQCRVALPGWYGFGSAHRGLPRRDAGDAHGSGWRCCSACTSSGRSSARCCRTWTWCSPRATCASPRATSSWSRTSSSASASSRAIEAEWQRTNDALSLITGETQRLPSNPALARSIEHRFPYLDPLNHLQVELMRRYRAAPTTASRSNERVQRGIHISINGIAAGLRNTG